MISNEHLFDVTTAPKMNSLHYTAGQVTWGELKEWMEQPASTKACGQYVLGRFGKTTVRHKQPDGTVGDPCTGLHRIKTAVEHRGGLTLDVDHATHEFLEKVKALPYTYILHTTYSSTAEEPRYRLLVPTSRTMTPDEYHAAAASVMQTLGEDNFDPGSVQPERYMFRPSEKAKGTFWYEVYEGPLADVEELLSDFQEDLSTVPLPRPHKNKRNPFEIEGTVGEFNRAYEDFAALIQEYDLPYESDTSDRWHLVGASAAAGMGVVSDGLVYSHHSNDPAYGQTCSAFDLVRLHMFGDLDENAKTGTPINKLPSTAAMLEVANMDPLVMNERYKDVAIDFNDPAGDLVASDDDEHAPDWRTGFRVNQRSGEPTDDIRNWDLIAQNDPVVQGLFYNELTMALQTEKDLPWRTGDAREVFDKADEAALANHIERTYRLKATDQTIYRMLSDGPRNRVVNPVADYLTSLTWDGKPRVETCLPGVLPTEYTRMVARKSLVAAAARMLSPGIKWDHMLMIVGDEGLGKSHWIERMSKGWNNNLGPIKDKDTVLAMHGSWITTSDEGHSMRKADFDALKEFLTRTHDKFRMPYDRDTRNYPRRCVIWGTTNDPAFMKRQEGNRRFLPVTATTKVDFTALTPEYVDQVWAEAVHLYRAGEPLWLNPEESAMAYTVRDEHMEDDPLPGRVQEFLETPLPSNWGKMSKMDRMMYIDSPDSVLTGELERIDLTCSAMLWDGLGHRNPPRPGETRPIIKAIEELPGWVKLPRQVHVPGYGKQTAFQRVDTLDGHDLI